MIRVTRLDGAPLLVNIDLLERCESTPETVLILADSQVVVILNELETILDKIFYYKKLLYSDWPIKKHVLIPDSDGNYEWIYKSGLIPMDELDQDILQQYPYLLYE